MNDKLANRMEVADRLLGEGKSQQAAAQIKRLLKGKVPRPFVARLAGLARRASLPNAALHLLGRHVRPFEKESAGLARPEEVIQYASTLLYLGATAEGLSLLAPFCKKHPEALFHQALGLISEWRYAETIGVLEAYLSSGSLTAYQRTVARVNLLAALVFEDRGRESESLLDSLLADTSKAGLHNLQGNVFQLGAILAIERKEESKAKRFLDRSETVLAQAPRNQILIRKWRAILGLTMAGKRTQNDWLEEIRSVASDAARSRLWEIVRDCDKYVALREADESRLLKVYFGTPFESYRAHLLKEWKRPLSLPNEYLWRLNAKTGSARVRLKDGEVEGKPLVKAGGILHRTLNALARDFYRPLRIAELHNRIYPGDHYHPETSPARVKTAVIRLRQRFAERGHRGAIEAQRNGYFFGKDAALEILVFSGTLLTASNKCLALLEKQWPSEPFTAKQAARSTCLSRRSVFRVLHSAVADGSLKPEGRGKSTRYRFSQQ